MRFQGRAVRGFTLLELMVVIVVIAILALMALPSFQGRIAHSQVAEVVRFVAPVERSIAEYHASTGEYPADNREAGLPAPDKYIGSYVTRLEIVQGAITVTLGNRVQEPMRGKRLSIRPAHVAGEPLVPVSWICGLAPVPAGLTVQGANRTDLEPLQLPLECRI